MSVDPQVAEGVRRLVSCGGIRPGEEVVLLTDDGIDPVVLAAFEAAVDAAGGERSTLRMRPRPQSGLEPTGAAAAAFAGAGLVIELTTAFVQHSVARQRAQRDGLRYLFVGDIDVAMLRGPGAVYADFAATAPRIEKLAALIGAATTMRITSPGGTDLWVDCTGRPGRALTGLATEPGAFGAPPCLEAGVIPVLGRGDGRVVVDAYCVGLGLVTEPFTVEIENGRAVRTHGSPAADQLARILADAANPNAYNVCEIGIGCNRDAALIDNVTSAEACYGTAHVALGTTPADPGIEIVRGGVHLDMVFHAPTITLDDQPVFRDGRAVFVDND